jgi:hypothetical protein
MKIGGILGQLLQIHFSFDTLFNENSEFV